MIFRRVRKIAEKRLLASSHVCLSVRSSVRMAQLGSHVNGFIWNLKIWYLRIFSKICPDNSIVLAFPIPLCSNYSILIKPSNTTKNVSLLSLLLSRTTCFRPWWWSFKVPKHVVLLSNKDNKDTYFVVFDGFISILQIIQG